MKTENKIFELVKDASTSMFKEAGNELSQLSRSMSECFWETAFPLVGDSPTELHIVETSNRPVKRGVKCVSCSNLTKKELKNLDSCPECGRSLFALKGRGW